MSDDGIIVCVPTKGMSADEAVPGSIKQWCSFCAGEVWLSPEAQRLAATEPSLKVACSDCVIGLMAQERAEVQIEAIPGTPLPEWMKHVALMALRRLVAQKRAES